MRLGAVDEMLEEVRNCTIFDVFPRDSYILSDLHLGPNFSRNELLGCVFRNAP